MLGSPRVITDSEGNVISRRDFTPFGEEITDNTGERTTAAKYGTADNLRQKFTTYQRDEETGLDFAEARMYENRHGRFTAVDPPLASGKSANPQTFNRFVYVLNNPLILADASGLQTGTPTGRWIRTHRQGETIDHLSYLPNSQALQSNQSEILDRNKQGDLIAGIPGNDDKVYRLNPYGPNPQLCAAGGILCPGYVGDYLLKGYDIINSPSFEAKYCVESPCEQGVQDVSFEFYSMVFGGAQIMNGTVRAVGKAAMESSVRTAAIEEANVAQSMIPRPATASALGTTDREIFTAVSAKGGTVPPQLNPAVQEVSIRRHLQCERDLPGFVRNLSVFPRHLTPVRTSKDQS